MNNNEDILALLRESRTIAVVGLSPKPHRESFGVARYLQAHGYRIIPVNPNAREALGERAYATLSEAAAHQPQDQPIDLVNCFRRSEDIPPIAEEAIAIGTRGLWMQLGIAHEAAADAARAAGLRVVQNACIKVEYARRMR